MSSIADPKRDCEHGQLRRVCNICELEEGIEMQRGNQAKKEQCTCPVGHKGVHYPDCPNYWEPPPPPVPDWPDMCRQLAEIEGMINNLKRQLMREAGDIKGV